MIAILSGCFECSKNKPNDDCEIYYQCNIKTVKLVKLKKKWTDIGDLKQRYNVFTFGISDRLIVFSWSSPYLVDFPTSFKLQEKIT